MQRLAVYAGDALEELLRTFPSADATR
jgi:hypothetical protein